MESFNKAKTGRFKTNQNSSLKGKFCLCFKPVSTVDDDAAFEHSSLSTILSSALMADCRERTNGCRRSSKKKGDDSHHNSFWQILKKAFNDTTLMKKIKRRKAACKTKISRASSIIMKIEKNSKQVCKSSLESSNNSSLFTRSSISAFTNSSTSSQTLGSSSSSSSSSSRTTLSLIATPKLIKDNKEKGANPDDDDRTKALCYILVTGLLILILWGKFFAIICVSFWLYLLPRRSEQSDEPPGQANKAEEEFDTAAYKKKVIMEGLLDRNRSSLMVMDSITRPFG